MADYTGLAMVFASGLDLIPHIEEAAFKYTMRNYVMAQRVKVMTDMTGWNVRKVSEYLHPERAVSLSEDTAIPVSRMERARKNTIEPAEYGHRHRISDRRADTDLENIVRDTVEALGKGVGDKKESLLIAAALDNFYGGALGSTTTDYDISLPITAQYEFRKRARSGQLWHVIHPFQAREVMQDLITTTAGGAMDFRNQAIAGWSIPAFQGLNIAISDFLPRHISYKIAVYGTGGTFRLQIGNGYTAGEHVTDAITVSATPATMVSNIKTALEALTIANNGTWTVSGTAINDITATPPAALLSDAEGELRVAVDYANPTVPGEQSAYDLVTGVTATVYDIFGDALGVQVFERSATCKSLLFFSDALIYDIRKPLQAYFELTMQGRTAEYSVYETYGVGDWRPELGMTIQTKCSSGLAVGS